MCRNSHNPRNSNNPHNNHQEEIDGDSRVNYMGKLAMDLNPKVRVCGTSSNPNSNPNNPDPKIPKNPKEAKEPKTPNHLKQPEIPQRSASLSWT